MSWKTTNKYQRWHDQIIRRAKARKAGDERHHIKPRCIGGSNSERNLVKLTYREHFLIHWLLTKIVGKYIKAKMGFALHNLTRKSNGARIVAGWQYEVARRAQRNSMLGNSFGKNPSPETRAKLRARNPNRPWLGKQHSKETKHKIGLAGRGNTRRLGKLHPCSEDRRRKQSAALKGRPWSAARRASHNSKILSLAQKKAWAEGKYTTRRARQ